MEREELVDDGNNIETGGEIAGDDLAKWIALPQVVALVVKHGAELVRLETFYECGRKADPRAEEPVAEREGTLVRDDVDPAIELEAHGCDDHGRRQPDLPRDQSSDEEGRRAHLAEEAQQAERDPAKREQEDEDRDDVRGVLGPSRQQLFHPRSERDEEREQDRARREREAEQDGEGAISALHVRPSARDGGARRDGSHPRCRAPR